MIVMVKKDNENERITSRAQKASRTEEMRGELSRKQAAEGRMRAAERR
jgi:hypothetical protein